tara:strand:- start:5140 stop:5835 length:696 start_codon:yes stop_codon:yes gene_type:complete
VQNSIDPTLFQTYVPLSFAEGATILIMSLLYGLYLRFLYTKLAITFSSKLSFGNTLLIVTISVASLVAVVKASLALSLGLVGALSVIRFRTAVKEPYNLSYILLSICIAISIGASQYLFALLITIVGTFAVFLGYKSYKGSKNKIRISDTEEIDTLHITLPSNSSLETINNILINTTSYFTFISLDQESEKPISLVVNVKMKDFSSIVTLKDLIFKEFPDSTFRFYNTPNI